MLGLAAAAFFGFGALLVLFGANASELVRSLAIDDERRQHVLGTLFAINMRSFGDTWNEPTIRGWMEAAGLERVDHAALGPDRWIISGHKPVR